MDRSTLKSYIGWGFLLWLIGYMLGILLFAVVPVTMIGWIITPIGVVITWWVLQKKIHAKNIGEYIMVGLLWTVIAIVCDYFFLVKLFKPADGYYKLDVYIYYLFTFLLPVIIGIFKKWIQSLVYWT